MPSPQPIEFDDERARTYRKRAEVLAFQSADPFRFQKDWGEQELREGGWLIVPIDSTGEPSADVYGCDADVFAATYEPSPSLRPHRFRKTETVRAYQPGHAFEIDTVLPDGHVEVSGARTTAYDAWVVRAPGAEVYPIENDAFRELYEEVVERGESYRIKTRDEHWRGDGSPKRLLALDGGGVRGILTIGYLERIEELLRARHGDSGEFRLCHYFDLMVGTSTGAIIAACLARGMKVAEVREMYEALAGDVFRSSVFRWGVFRAKFKARRLKKHLKDVFQENTMGSSALQTGLVVVAKRLDTGSTWPMSNNPRAPYFTASPDDTYLANEDYSLRAVVRASTAAPMFFSPERIIISPEKKSPTAVFVDGGVSPHNNPALLALQLVSSARFGANWTLDPDKLLLVSLGTGSANPGVSSSPFAGQHAVKSLLSLMDDCAASVETLLQWFSNSPTARHIDRTFDRLDNDLVAERPLLSYLRYNVALDKQWLAEHLKRDLPAKQLEELTKMDRPGNMPLLSELGVAAAGVQLDDSHFPPGFDLG